MSTITAPPLHARKRRTGLLVAAVSLLAAACIAVGVTLAFTHRSVMPSKVQYCNAQFRAENFWLNKANAALGSLNVSASERYLAKSKAAGARLKAAGCPNGPYPLSGA